MQTHTHMHMHTDTQAAQSGRGLRTQTDAQAHRLASGAGRTHELGSRALAAPRWTSGGRNGRRTHREVEVAMAGQMGKEMEVRARVRAELEAQM